MKGYKITNGARSKTVGVACKTFSDLKKKGVSKLGLVETEDKIVVALEDGTFVDDEEYFLTLPAQTVFVFYRQDQPITTGWYRETMPSLKRIV